MNPNRPKPLVGRACFLIAILALAPSAQANLFCSGTLTRVSMHPNGVLQINIGYGVHYLCSFTQNYGSFTPETCRAAYSMLLSAYHAGSPVTLAFNANYTACTELPDWAEFNPSPYHIALTP